MSERSPGTVGLAAGVVLIGSTVLALRRPLPEWELRLTEWVNNAPESVERALYPVMQVGAGLAPVLVAGVVLVVRRDRWAAAAVAAGGLGAWFTAKALKQLVSRDRPLAYLSGLDVREGDGSGLGFPSGHAAVAASIAVTLAVVVPRRWRPLLVAVAGLVGVARIVVGVHLPVDVVGGWSLGVLTGLGAVAIAELATITTSARASAAR